MSDTLLARLARVAPTSVPITQIGRALRLLETEEQRDRLIRSITRRRPRDETDRRTLLALALSTRAGGIAFVDFLGGFDGQRPS